MFHFKKFSINDSKAAMKIGTDAVLLGAWTPCGGETRILDIGTGSGILALMMAQRNSNAEIDAVEIDSDAASLAKGNVDHSPWCDRIQIFNSSLQDFSSGNRCLYSLIISNPPFFTDSLKAPDKARNLARHNDSLPVKELLECSSEMLTKNGKASFIITADAYKNWKNEASKQQLFPEYVTWVKSSAANKPHRAMVVFSHKNQITFTENELIIYSMEKIHSPEYRKLTSDFYLKF